MDPDLSILEVIGLAVKNEDDAAVFYTDFSKIIKNELVQAKFQFLAEEEKKHSKMLTDFYKKLSGEPLTPPKVPGAAKSVEGPTYEFTVDSIEALLNLAIKREMDASEFYKSAAEKSENNSGRRMLEYLSRIEELHAVTIRAELKSYLEDKDWYTDTVDIMLV